MPDLLPRLLRRPWTAVMAALALVFSVLVVVPASGSALASGCRVDYTVNEWAGGYSAQVRITRTGSALNGWRLTWTYGGDRQVTSAWNATVTQTGHSVTAVNAAWNGAVADGGPSTSVCRGPGGRPIRPPPISP